MCENVPAAPHRCRSERCGIENCDRVTQVRDAVWRQHSVRRQIEAVARTTNGTYKVNQQTLGGVRIQVPSIELQREFDARVGTVDRQRAAARRALVTEDALFASLQCEAFRPDRSDFLK